MTTRCVRVVCAPREIFEHIESHGPTTLVMTFTSVWYRYVEFASNMAPPIIMQYFLSLFLLSGGRSSKSIFKVSHLIIADYRISYCRGLSRTSTIPKVMPWKRRIDYCGKCFLCTVIQRF